MVSIAHSCFTLTARGIDAPAMGIECVTAPDLPQSLSFNHLFAKRLCSGEVYDINLFGLFVGNAGVLEIAVGKFMFEVAAEVV